MADYKLKFLFSAHGQSSVAKATESMRRGFGNVAASGKKLKAADTNLTKMQKSGAKAATANAMLARRVKAAQRGVGDYSRSLKTGTRALRSHTSAAMREIAAQKRLQGEYVRTGKARGKLGAGRKTASAAGTGAPGLSEMASVAAPVLAVSLPVKKAIEFESAMADVRKVVNFKEPDGLKKFGQDLIRLSKKEIPIGAAGLAQIAAAGGQLGIAEGDLLSYVRTTSKMAVAFDMLPDEAGDASAKLANVFKIPVSEIDRLGDAINHLSDNTPAKAREIVRGMLRAGGITEQFGLGAQQTAALTGAFIALGKPPEVAGTAINGMLTKLLTAEKGGKAFQKALDAIGTDAYELKDAIQDDAQGALVSFLDSIAQMDKADQMGVLVDLFGREYADDIATLVGSLDKYKDSLGLVAKEQSYLGSMTKEFQNKANTTANKLQMLGNKASGLFIDSGTDQLSVVNSLAASAGKVLDVISGLSAEFPRAASGLAHLVGGAAAAIAVFKGLKLAGRFFKSGFADFSNLGRKGINLVRGKRGKASRRGKGGALGGLTSAASDAMPVFVTNWPGGGLGGLGADVGGGKGKARTRRRGPKIKAGRKGILGRAAGLMGRAASAGGLMAGAAPGVAKAGTGILGKGVGKSILKAGGKSLLKKIPGLGLLAGIGFGLERALSGDWLGAAGEVASGAASMVPGIGTAASMALDAGLAAHDITREPEGAEAKAQAEQKQAEQALPAQPAAQAGHLGGGEMVWNVSVNQTVNAPGADAKSLAATLAQGRIELEQMIKKTIDEHFWSQQRTGFNNA